MTNNYFKNKVGLDFVLLAILVINFIWTSEKWHWLTFVPLTGNSPVNFYFFYFAFICLLIYFFTGFLKINDHKKFYIKLTVILSLIFFLLISFCVYQIALRKMGASMFYTHDGIIQTEEAVKFLDQGKNPYAENYQPTVFGQFLNAYAGAQRENPAWYHYVYLPFYLLFSWPFYKVSHLLFGFFDERIILIIVFLASLAIIYKLPEKREKKLLGLIIFAFNPIFFPWLAYGFNDIFVFFWLLFSLYLLKLKKYGGSAAVLALACAAKQQAWLFLPFYFFYLYFEEEKIKDIFHKVTGVFKKIIPFIVVSSLIYLPFLIWGFKDFIDDIYRYPTGSISTSLPMVGYGISYLVYKAGFVKSMWDYFPFWIIQIIICLPLLYYLIKKQREDNSLSWLFISYGLFLLVFWFFSRVFNDNYISYLSLVFLASFLIEEKESLTCHESLN